MKGPYLLSNPCEYSNIQPHEIMSLRARYVMRVAIPFLDLDQQT